MTTTTPRHYPIRFVWPDEMVDLDPLVQVPVRSVTTRSLRPGMILVDDLGCRYGVLTERIGHERGCVSWRYRDLDARGVERATSWVVGRSVLVEAQ